MLFYSTFGFVIREMYLYPHTFTTLTKPAINDSIIGDPNAILCGYEVNFGR